MAKAVRLTIGCLLLALLAPAAQSAFTQAEAATPRPKSGSPAVADWHPFHVFISARSAIQAPCGGGTDRGFGVPPWGYCKGGFVNIPNGTPPLNTGDVGASVDWTVFGGEKVDVKITGYGKALLHGILPNRGSGDLHITDANVPDWNAFGPISSGEDTSLRGKPGGTINFNAEYSSKVGNLGYWFHLDGYLRYATASPPKLNCQLGPAEVGKEYRQQCLQEGGPPAPTIQREGDLPPGVTMTQDLPQGNAIFGGVPERGGQFGFGLKASNGVPPDFSGPASITVGPASSATAIAAEPKDRSVFGEPVTLTGVVSHPHGNRIPTTPTGTVRFYEGSSPICSGTLSRSGEGKSTAKCTTQDLKVTHHAITATYDGDASFKPSTSAHLSHTVEKNHTITGVTSMENPSVLDHPIAFTAKVRPAEFHAGPPGGKIQFTVNGRDLGPPVDLDNGSAKSSPTSALALGKHTVTASYQGDESFLPSIGGLRGGQTVEPKPTITSVSPSLSPVSGQPLSFTAKVVPREAGVTGTPGGDVEFFVDKKPLGGPVHLTNGIAASPEVKLNAGTYSVTASYEGKGEFAKSHGELPGGLVVGRAAASVTLSSSQNPSIARHPVTFTAAVKAQPPGSGTPGGGTVQFFVDGQPFGKPAGVKDGSAKSEPNTSLEAGNRVVTAFYSGHTDFMPSSALPLRQKVNP